MRTMLLVVLAAVCLTLLAGCPPPAAAQSLGTFAPPSLGVPTLSLHQAAPIIPNVPAVPSRWSVGLVQGGVPLGETGGCVSYQLKDLIVCKLYGDGGLVKDQDAEAYCGFLGLSTDLQFVPILSSLLGKLPGGGRAGAGPDWGATRGRWFASMVLTSTQF